MSVKCRLEAWTHPFPVIFHNSIQFSSVQLNPEEVCLMVWGWICDLDLVFVLFMVFLVWSAILVFLVFYFCWCYHYFLFYFGSLSFPCWVLFHFPLFISLSVCTCVSFVSGFIYILSFPPWLLFHLFSYLYSWLPLVPCILLSLYFYRFISVEFWFLSWKLKNFCWPLLPPTLLHFESQPLPSLTVWLKTLLAHFCVVQRMSSVLYTFEVFAPLQYFNLCNILLFTISSRGSRREPASLV